MNLEEINSPPPELVRTAEALQEATRHATDCLNGEAPTTKVINEVLVQLRKNRERLTELQGKLSLSQGRVQVLQKEKRQTWMRIVFLTVLTFLLFLPKEILRAQCTHLNDVEKDLEEARKELSSLSREIEHESFQDRIVLGKKRKALIQYLEALQVHTLASPSLG